MQLPDEQPAFPQLPAFGLPKADPRHPELGMRAIFASRLIALELSTVTSQAYERHRIALGVPKGGVDFRYADSFPQDANFDELNGVDFAKGCYIGQEVVARMQHRGRARKRILRVRFTGSPPPAGTEIRAGADRVGDMGSSADGEGLAMMRLDRLEEALVHGKPLIADGAVLEVVGALPQLSSTG